MRHLRTKARSMLTVLTSAAAVAVVGLLPGALPARTGAVTAAATSQAYSWNNVQIGGGGFVPGIVFNEGRSGLVYARTDVGGAYRQDPASGKWIPLLDSIGWSDWNLSGVASLATDAADPNRVYLAAGSYTNSWDPNDGAILRSDDQGATWQRTVLPFKVGGNMPGRGMGERLGIDPNNDKVLYFGAESGNGLWRSADYGVTWAKVSSFPDTGPYAPLPSDTTGYQSDPEGVLWEVFDKGSGTVGGVTKTVYVGVADKAHSIYRSDDGGSTWTAVTGQPTGMIPHKAVLDASGGNLFITYSDTGGPYDGAHGDVWKYATGTGTWSNVSPVPSTDTSNDYFGYSGLTVDREHPGTLMVTAYSSWWPDTQIWRSTDSGATWKPFWAYTSYPTRVDQYTIDLTPVPWLTMNANPSPPEEAPKLGWMTESLAIDPFNSDRMFYGTGATVYATTQLTNWDRNTTFTIKPMAKGLEETAVLDLASPPSGAPLVSALGDIGGFYHADLDTVPAGFHDTPSLGSNTSLDFAELSPAFFVRVGNADAAPHIGISSDGGQNWYASQEPSGVTGGGTVAVGADAGAVVWAPAGTGVYFSTTRGNSWTASTGIPAGALVESDRVNPRTFYAYAAGQFYTSKDGGATFTASSAAMPASGRVHLKAVPGVAGEVWLAGSTGLLRSTDSGATFTKVAAVTSGVNVAFGKAAPGATHPAVFLVGTVDGVTGVFRSDNTGTSWVRINDDAHQYGNAGDALAGDPRVYGRVYLGTNGRGILYADRLGGATASPSPTPTPTPTTPPATGGCTATYQITGQWAGGFQGEVTVKNTGTAATKGWTVGWAFTAGQTLSQTWNGTGTQSGTAVTVKDAGYNGVLAAGASTTFGFLANLASTGNPVPSPITCTPAP